MGRVFELVKAPLVGLSSTVQAITNMLRNRPVLPTFQINLGCNSACGYCDLSLNQGCYEMSHPKRFGGSSRTYYGEGIRFVLEQGGEPMVELSGRS